MHITALGPVLERLAVSLGKVFSPDAMRGLVDEMNLDESGIAGLDRDAAQQFAAMAPMLAPVLLGVQAGSMIGYLARHALGRYDLPLPDLRRPRARVRRGEPRRVRERVVARARRPSLLRRDPRGRARCDALRAVGARAACQPRQRVRRCLRPRRRRSRPATPRLTLRGPRSRRPLVAPGVRVAARAAAPCVAHAAPGGAPRPGTGLPRSARGLRGRHPRAASAVT